MSNEETQSEANRKRVVKKADALECCRYAISSLAEVVCGSKDYTLQVPDGLEAAVIANDLQGRVVKEFEDVVNKGGVLVRRKWAVVRITTGLLTTTVAAGRMPAQLIEIIAESQDIGVSRVKSTVAAEQIGQVEYEDLAKQIGKTDSIKGESVKEFEAKGITRASAIFNVMNEVISIYNLAQDGMEGRSQDKQEEVNRTACCRAVTDAWAKVWEKAPDKFHTNSLKTRDGGVRYNGIKKSRRN